MCLVLIDLLLLIVWLVVDPFTWQMVPLPSYVSHSLILLNVLFRDSSSLVNCNSMVVQLLNNNADVIYQPLLYICSSNYIIYFSSTFYGFKGHY